MSAHMDLQPQTTGGSTDNVVSQANTNSDSKSSLVANDGICEKSLLAFDDNRNDFQSNAENITLNEATFPEDRICDGKLGNANLELGEVASAAKDDYTILSKNERVFFALLLSAVGLGSSVSMPIYWAALTDMAHSFDTTEAKINYTITAYLCFQAVAPVFISSLSDIFGRRPVIIVCLAGGIVINICLAVSRKYWMVVFFRCLLASFLAPLISITSATVGDFTTRINRAGLSGLTNGFILIGQGIAPFLGAVMDAAWDWEAIFWFSAIMDAVILISVLFLLPETHRGFVGNLGIKPKLKIHQSPVLFYFKDRIKPYDETKLMPFDKAYNPWKPLKLATKPAVFLLLVPISLTFALFTISQTSLSTHLSNDYHYKTIIVGVCFFAPGAATMIGAVVSGKVLDRFYRKKKKEYDDEYGMHQSLKSDIPPFNIIYVRLYYIPFATAFILCGYLIFGWCIEYKINVAVILVIFFLATLVAMLPMNTITTILIDMYPEIAGGATALNNLFRCGMSAIFVSCLSQMENSMTTGGTYSFMFGIGIVSISLLVILIRKSESFLAKQQS